MTIPNILTMMRIVLIPLFVMALMYSRYDYALGTFCLAALTDFFDGLIARVKNQKSELGKFLDPLADKFLLITSFILFAYYGFIPKWLTITVISRDVIIVTGWLLLFILGRKKTVNTTMLGKVSNTFQLILLAYILLKINIDKLPSAAILLYITAFFTALSGIHYVYRELK